MKKVSSFFAAQRKWIATGSVAAIAMIAGITQLHVDAQNVTFRSARDCDGNAIMYCGAMNLGELAQKYNASGNIQAVYRYFGIDSNEVRTMPATAVAGKVAKNGDVLVNGKVVATGAVTAGRHYIPGSAHVNYQGASFYKRSPSVSFASSSLDAYVVMVNGKFSFAVLAACGNPVVATPKPVPPKPQPPKPQPKPDYSIVKQVQKKGDSTWVENVTVKDGARVNYRVAVKNTGKVEIKNLVVKDTLPQGVAYVPGTLKRDGVAVAGGEKFFTTGVTVPSLKAGAQTVFSFEASISDKGGAPCKPVKMVNVAKMTAPSLPPKQDDASVNKECEKPLPPKYACESLTLTKKSRTSYQLKAVASAERATIESYTFDFGDGKTATTKSPVIDYAYEKHGNYTAKVTANVKVGNEVTKVTGPQCAKPLTVAPAPVAECKDLELDVVTGRKIKATVTHTASEGVEVKSISYDFGDGTKPVVTKDATVEHTFAKDGEYTVKATMTFTIEGEDVDSICEAPVKFETPVVPEVPEEPKEETPAPEQPEAPKGEAPAPQEQPAIIPETGAGAIAGIAAAVTVGSTVAYQVVASRRARF